MEAARPLDDLVAAAGDGDVITPWQRRFLEIAMTQPIDYRGRGA